MSAQLSDSYTPQTAPPYVAHIKRLREDGEPADRALCGNRWGGFAVAEPGAWLPHLLPVENLCETCAAAHQAGSV